MDIYTLQAIEALRANPNVQKGGKFGQDPYGKISGIWRMTTRGTTQTHSSSSFNSAARWHAFIAGILGAKANGTGTIGSTTNGTNYSGFRYAMPDRRFYVNAADKSNGVHVMHLATSDNSGGYQYGNTLTCMLPIKNTSNTDITLNIYGVGSSYSTHSYQFMWTLVPDDTDKSAVTNTTFTAHYSYNSGTTGYVNNVSITFPAGKTIILGMTGSAYYVYQQHQAGYNLSAGFNNLDAIAANASLETDYEMLAAIECRAATPDFDATTEAGWNTAISTLWPNSLDSMTLEGKVGAGAV